MQDEGDDEASSPEHIEQLAQGPGDLDPTIDAIGAAYPLPSNTDAINKGEMMKRAIAELPKKERAAALVECYYLRAAWESVHTLYSR